MYNKDHYHGAGVLAAWGPGPGLAPQGGDVDTLEQGQERLRQPGEGSGL